MSSLKITPVEKNSLFFNKYRYSARFVLTELGAIRGLKLNKIDNIVNQRNAWRRQHQGLYSGYRQLITDTNVKDLKTVCRILKKHEKDIKFVISYDHGYVYTNNLALVKELNNIDCIGHFNAQEVVQVCPPGTIALKDPKWTHRTYFRSVSLTDQQKSSLTEYLQSREGLRLSPGLKNWMENNQHWGNYTQNYFFFDHNNNGEVLFLNMVVARITGRTMQIVAK